MKYFYYLWKQIDEIDPSSKRYAEHPSAFILFSIILIVQLMKEIKLTQGKSTFVDDEDYEYLNQWKWYAHKIGKYCYAQRGIRINGKQEFIYMHRAIMNTSIEMMVDHIDHNTLNNIRNNLRICSCSQNYANAIKRMDCSSIYKGVTWNKKINKWSSQIGYNYKNYNLGIFEIEKNAAKKYDEFALKYYGKFANLNFK